MADTQSTKAPNKQQYCRDCRDDFYNKPGNSTGGMCWSLKDAQIVTRFRLHWWSSPAAPRAFTEVTTLSCHYEPGQFAFYKELPDFAVEPQRLAINTP